MFCSSDLLRPSRKSPKRVKLSFEVKICKQKSLPSFSVHVCESWGGLYSTVFSPPCRLSGLRPSRRSQEGEVGSGLHALQRPPACQSPILGAGGPLGLGKFRSRRIKDTAPRVGPASRVFLTAHTVVNHQVHIVFAQGRPECGFGAPLG